MALSTPRDPLEQTYLVVQNVDKYFLLPVDHSIPPKQHEGESIMSEINIKTEVQDILEDTTEQLLEESELNQKPHLVKPQYTPGLPIQLPLQLSRLFEQCSKPESMIVKSNLDDVKMQDDEKIFTCDHCPKTFSKKYSLRRHMATHNSALNFECVVCHQLLKTKRTLRLHMVLHEDSGKMFQCSDCGFMSKRSHSLKRHQIRIHSKYFNYKCPHCPKMFKLSSDYTRHQMKHVVAPCRCEVCGKVYQNEFFLRVHRTMGKNRRTACCVRYERIRSDLNVAEYTTTPHGKIVLRATSTKKKKGDVKRFNCPQCKWRFSSWRLLHKHLQRHLLSYKCDICGVVFKYKASFLKHKESHKD
ncbi:uncharacterized protein LOC143433130 [Xylocopa sonorina]|uniref:uncharacterized protein LOC143433130 n=1 Tax=Xylocopa sonorina TaxID=1818115 RepID=UPI00403B1F48